MFSSNLFVAFVGLGFDVQFGALPRYARSRSRSDLLDYIDELSRLESKSVSW